MKFIASLIFIVIFTSINFLSVSAQTVVPKAIKLISKNKQESAFRYLDKLFDKDSINPEYYYSFSILHSIDSLTFYDLDTSYHHINSATSQYSSISDKKRLEYLKKNGIDSTTLHSQKKKIENAAFQRALENNTEAHFNYFLRYFDLNIWSDSVVTLRNKIAFQTALNQNTYVGYRKFIETYPSAKEVEKARYRFERLYFDESTNDNKLSSYTNFLVDHPQTHYRDIAEKRILELSTLLGSTSNFLDFIKSYPESKYVELATNFIYHLDNKKLPAYLWTDSLKEEHAIRSTALIPLYKFQKFGFMSTSGAELIPPKFDNINGKYLCEITTQDFLEVTSSSDPLIVNKSGKLIHKGFYESIMDLGSGLLSIETNDKSKVVHKSGYEILQDDYNEIKLIDNGLLAVNKHNLWGLYSLLGTPIFAHEYDDIVSFNNFVILSKNDKYAITNTNLITNLVEDEKQELLFDYDNIEYLPNGNLLVESSRNQNILTPSLKPVFRNSTQEIKQENNYLVVKEHNLYHLYGNNNNLAHNKSFTEYKNNQLSFFIKRQNYWLEINGEIQYDSIIVLSNSISLGMETDSITFFLGENQLKKPVESVFRIIKDNGYLKAKQEFIVFTYDESIEVYNLKGKIIYKDEVEKITALGPSLIVIQKDGKKGVIDSDGEIVIELKMDAIGNYDKGLFSVLSNRKFGIHNTQDNTSILPGYERALKQYNAEILIAHKDGFYGLIDKHNLNITEFIFEEIRYWNDTSALVKQNYHWKIYNWKTNDFALDNIKEYATLKHTKDEIVLKTLVDSEYGVLSNTKGFIIPSTYNDIIDIGSAQKPLYLAERNIEEAAFYVTIYYDDSGKIIYKQAHEAEDYQHILCDNN